MSSAAAAFGALLPKDLKYLKVDWEPERGVLRLRMRVKPIQCFSLRAMAETKKVVDAISANPGPVRHFVLCSDVPGVFNFGGDLSLFALLVRARDLKSLKMYGQLCLDLVWWTENASSLGVHTIALVQGDALGGGLESALPFDKIIVERSAQAGFPEILFNLFPGMGAWNFTTRKAGLAIANEMVLSGKLYQGDALLRMGIADLVVDDGKGEEAVEQAIRAVEPRLRGTLAALRARRRMAPITRDGLTDIVNDWAEAALTLTDRDLKLMERLARAQLKKVGGGDGGAVEEIKRMELEEAWAAAGEPLSEPMPLAA